MKKTVGSLVILMVIVCVVLCVSCAISPQKESLPLKQDEINNHQEEIKNETELIHDEIIANPWDYNNPYEEPDEYGAPSALYWELYYNGIKLVNRICKELDDSGWKNIRSMKGFSNQYHECAVYLTEAERERFIFTVEGSVDCLGKPAYVIVIVTLSEDNPMGEISRVVYASVGGRIWEQSWSGYDQFEIVDAYTLDLWETMTSY